ncbi:MAG: formylglycine-generating enzyme family protein [Phycisphaerales bacterium]|nr:formylglycine-generating enzyme family protein [Phycisphaerales bacterium]
MDQIFDRNDREFIYNKLYEYKKPENRKSAWLTQRYKWNPGNKVGWVSVEDYINTELSKRHEHDVSKYAYVPYAIFTNENEFINGGITDEVVEIIVQFLDFISKNDFSAELEIFKQKNVIDSSQGLDKSPSIAPKNKHDDATISTTDEHQPSSEDVIIPVQQETSTSAKNPDSKNQPSEKPKSPWRKRAVVGALSATALTVMVFISTDEKHDSSITRSDPILSEQRTKPDKFLQKKDCSFCPTMVLVNAGTFMMGSAPSELGRSPDEGPQHLVTIASPFFVSKFEISEKDWLLCVKEQMCRTPEPFPHNNDKTTLDAPITNVSWDDAKNYVQWLSQKTNKKYRLLSEAEWEFAARGGTKSPFSIGNTISTDDANFDGRKIYGRGKLGLFKRAPSSVGSFSPNPSGLYDMHGNVAEWVEDCWNKSYASKPPRLSDTGRPWVSGQCFQRVIRGGSWGMGPNEARSAFRTRATATSKNSHVGFRIARNY